MGGPVVSITELPSGRWGWDVWFRGPSGVGVVRRGVSATERGAKRKAERAQRRWDAKNRPT